MIWNSSWLSVDWDFLWFWWESGRSNWGIISEAFSSYLSFLTLRRIDCVGILKLRNADIELRNGETDIGRKNTRVRLVFRVHIPSGGQLVSLQVASDPIECCKECLIPQTHLLTLTTLFLLVQLLNIQHDHAIIMYCFPVAFNVSVPQTIPVDIALLDVDYQKSGQMPWTFCQ